MRLIISILSILLLSFIYPAVGQAAPSVSANNAILIEQSTGRILFEKRANEEQLIASITKIMTAIIAIESGKMKEKATTSRKAIYTEGSSIYLEQGEKMTVEDLTYGLMLRSGNDAAVAISEHIGGSEEGFVYLMNKKAHWLGMTNTKFDNPHGLDSAEHYSSAYDMAMLMRYAMDNDQFKVITGTKSYQSKNRTYSWINKNKLLTQYYEYCIGGKTGFTKKTGRTLVSSAHKNGMDLIAVTLNAPDDWRDHISMFEWGFDNYDMKSIAEKGKAVYKVNGTGKRSVGYLHNESKFPMTASEKDSLSSKTYLLKGNHKLTKGKIGKTIYYLDGQPIRTIPIFANEQQLPQKGFLSELISLYKKIAGMKYDG